MDETMIVKTALDKIIDEMLLDDFLDKSLIEIVSRGQIIPIEEFKKRQNEKARAKKPIIWKPK